VTRPRLPAWLAAARRSRLRRAGRAALVGVAALALVALVALRLTPPSLWIDRARFARPHDAFEVLDRRGEVLRHARVAGVDRRWIALGDVSPDLVAAVIAAEDARFRAHDGVDGLATLRALAAGLRPWGRRSGASTITQQLVKLVYGRPLGPVSKLAEIARAAALERVFTKDEILEQYLNRVPFGDRIEGVARASEEYFGRPASALSLAEAALLAGVPQAPSATEPRRHLARALRRRAHVLGRMAALGMIDEPTWRSAAAEAPQIRAVPPRPDEAPRFVDAVVSRYREGRAERGRDGLRTSLDLRLSRRTGEILSASVARFEARGVTNGAAVVVANATGEILAHVGAARRDGPGGSLDLPARRRQPGSALKPFAYGLFFERGGTAATVLDDVSLPRTGARGSSFDARDYDGRERGPVRARPALAGSLNLAALDVAGRVGQDALVARLRALGLHGVEVADHYGAAAVLGGLDVAPLDLAVAYVTLARGGTRVPLVYTPPSGAPLAGDPVMTPASAAVVRDVLEDARARADAFGADLTDLAGGRFALKTGTSSGWRDAWAAAFTDAVTVVVWLGDPEGRPLGAVSGFEAAAPAAARILAAAAAVEVAPPERSPVRLVPATVCAATGLRPGDRCAHLVEERFAPGTLPAEVCEAHDERGDLLLPPRYADWIQRTHPPGIARAPLAVAAALEPPVVREPRDGARWLVDPARGPTSVPLRASAGGAEIADVRWEVDGVRLAGASWELAPGDHAFVAAWQGRRSRPAWVHVDRGDGR
jgi:penicillin-binding protein 1C